MPHKSLHALRREAPVHAWRVYASIAPLEGQTRLVLNATRDTGGATELTSTLPDGAAAMLEANRLALTLGGAATAIVWGPPSLSPITPALGAAIAA